MVPFHSILLQANTVLFHREGSFSGHHLRLWVRTSYLTIPDGWTFHKNIAFQLFSRTWLPACGFLRFCLAAKHSVTLWILDHPREDVHTCWEHVCLYSQRNRLGACMLPLAYPCTRVHASWGDVCSCPSTSLEVMKDKLCKHCTRSQPMNTVAFHNQLPQKRCQAHMSFLE